ncbi:MAG: PEGA domain-containing protein [Myxococcales bacterium]|nr:PEGA domain-containing protein [Myxococcales bacterium]
MKLHTARLAQSLAALGALAVLTASMARADDACDTQFVEGQKSEKAGKLLEALDAFTACAAVSCGTNMSNSCNKRRATVAEKIPSVVVVATEGSKSLSKVTVSMDGAPIAADGKAVSVNPGPHTFKFVTADGRSKTVEAVVVEGKKSQEVSASFDPVGGSGPTNGAAPTGRLSIVAGPEDAILVDGKTVGIGRFDGPLPVGGHTVRVTGSGKKPYETQVELAAGATRTLDVTLEKEKSSGVPTWLWIAGGTVVVGGLAVGGYFLFKPGDTPASPATGRLETLQLKGFSGVRF